MAKRQAPNPKLRKKKPYREKISRAELRSREMLAGTLKLLGVKSPRSAAAIKGRRRTGTKTAKNSLMIQPLSGEQVRSIVREELQRNPAPSLVGNVVGTFFPLDTMRTLGQGAANDVRRLVGNPRRRNHGETAADVFEGFHGTPATRTEVVEDKLLIDDDLAQCGPLISIRCKVVTGFTTTIKFHPDRMPDLTSSKDRNQLYAVGGDQELDLDGLGFTEPEQRKALMVIGIAKQVTYFTQKGFDNFEPTDYFHDLGEETGKRPTLIYDALNKSISFAGGEYRVLDEGITN